MVDSVVDGVVVVGGVVVVMAPPVTDSIALLAWS